MMFALILLYGWRFMHKNEKQKWFLMNKIALDDNGHHLDCHYWWADNILFLLRNDNSYSRCHLFCGWPVIIWNELKNQHTHQIKQKYFVWIRNYDSKNNISNFLFSCGGYLIWFIFIEHQPHCSFSFELNGNKL